MSTRVIENEATAEHVAYCWDKLISHFDGKAGPVPPFANANCPLFVTWKKRSRANPGGEPQLRGCIGNLSPMDLHSSLGKYVLISALQDRRFSPIDAGELPLLECTVSLLTNFEEDLKWNDWEVGTHGIIIEFESPSNGYGHSYSATYLPEVAKEQGWTKEEAIDSLVQKAGFRGILNRDAIRLTRYQSSIHTSSYQEYLARKESS